MTNLDPQWIEAGTTALMACLYGSDLGGADYGDMFDGQVQMHREQVTDVLAAVVPLILAAKEQRAAELRELLLDQVSDYGDACRKLAMVAVSAADNSALREHKEAAGVAHSEIVRLAHALANRD